MVPEVGKVTEVRVVQEVRVILEVREVSEMEVPRGGGGFQDTNVPRRRNSNSTHQLTMPHAAGK